LVGFILVFPLFSSAGLRQARKGALTMVAYG